MKLPFGLGRNKQSNDSLPAEIQDYYQSQRREKAGVAWLLAAGVFIVTLLIAMALFFGGRWAYRQITDRGNDAPATGQNEQQDEGANGAQGSGDTEETPVTPNDPSRGGDIPGQDGQPTPSQPAPQPTVPSTGLPDTNGDR